MRFGRLTYVRELPKKAGDAHRRALWKCDCGTEKEVAISRVRNGYTKSCGCLVADVVRANSLRHGKHGSPEYLSWQAMKVRCLDPDHRDYPGWGGSGVTIHQEWISSFDAFLTEVGPRPAGTTLDRINNDLGYEPGNVRWATSKVQSENRSDSWNVEIDGVLYASLAEAALAHDVSETTIVRWCDGYIDARRPHLGRKSPRANCRKWKKYAA